RQQKMAGTGLGDRDAFGIKTGPAGAVVQVFQGRGGKVVERIELVTSEGGGGTPEAGGRPEAAEPGPQTATEEDVLQAALEEVHAEQGAATGKHVPQP